MPALHCSLEGVSKRRPGARADRRFRDFTSDARVHQVRQNLRRMPIFTLRNEVFGKSPIVQETLLEKQVDDRFRRFAELVGEFSPDLCDRVVPPAQEFERVMVDCIHDRLC